MIANIFFADGYYGYDDALYAAVRLLAILQSSGESLADFRDALPPVVNTPAIRVPFPEDLKRNGVQEIKARLIASGAAGNDIYGVRVRQHGGGWRQRAPR